LLANASWGRLAREFVDAKRLADRGDTSSLQTFVNCVLAQGWAGPGETVDETVIATMIVDFNLDRMPPVAMYLCAGVDVQSDRLEMSICGFDADNTCHVLSHQRIWGNSDDAETWQMLSQLLSAKWKHPFGAPIGITATCIDSGFATEKVYDYAFARGAQRVYAIKGLPGNRPAIQRSTDKVVRGRSTRNSGRLWLIGTHAIKSMLFSRLQSGKLLRFSSDLDEDYFEQLSSERVSYVYRGGRRWPKFEQISGRPNHAFDTLVYAHAARATLTISNWKEREETLRGHGTIQRESMGKKLFDAYGRRPTP
jgi:phage terminase large subunit GpA-like protein